MAVDLRDPSVREESHVREEGPCRWNRVTPRPATDVPDTPHASYELDLPCLGHGQQARLRGRLLRDALRPGVREAVATSERQSGHRARSDQLDAIRVIGGRVPGKQAAAIRWLTETCRSSRTGDEDSERES